MTHRTEDLALTYVELREEITSAAFTANVDPNSDNGLVEVWIDPATLNVSAVANIRLTPDEARAMGAALIGAANALDAPAPAWVHAMDGTPCGSGPLVEDEAFCADHDRRITKKEN